jgi:hypothetical protein
MGCGSWDTKSFVSYSTARGYDTDSRGVVTGSYSNQEMFKAKNIDAALDPKGVIRECCDNEEHPNTLPVILALDVTGSMGQTAVEIAKRLNEIMTKLYGQIKDVEFMIMGIGDLAYDTYPIQASQFESDIRIAEQLDKIYFEFGGGGNWFESYTAAWYFGSRHTKLDCWNRGKKGVIITIGDERLNPYLPRTAYYCGLSNATGDSLQADVETKDLYTETAEKFDIYHINVNHRGGYDQEQIKKSFLEYLDDKHFCTINKLDDITDTIVEIITSANESNNIPEVTPLVQAETDESGAIVW